MFRVTALLKSWVSGLSGGAGVRSFNVKCLIFTKAINVNFLFLLNLDKIEKSKDLIVNVRLEKYIFLYFNKKFYVVYIYVFRLSLNEKYIQG